MFLEFYSKILLEVKYPDYNIEICKKLHITEHMKMINTNHTMV